MFYKLDSWEDLPAELVGGKASNLNELLRRGYNVPPGFVADVKSCFAIDFTNTEYKEGSSFNLALSSHIRHLADQTETVWNSDLQDKQPLIVSVRSGAPISMPGMMDTILNIGLTKENLGAFVKAYNAPMSFGLDCYRRLIQMYGSTVKGISTQAFSTVYDAAKIFWGDLGEEELLQVISLYENIYKRETGEEFETDPNKQLLQAANAVFKSWYSPKAKAYRALEGIEESIGTAVTVQKMVFGNLDDNSATGVVFTHNPNTGEKNWYGDFLKRAQGEDVVAGTHKVQPIASILDDPNLKAAGTILQNNLKNLYNLHRDILDVEFTIEKGTLYILQYRIAKRSRAASIRNILDMTREGEISTETATKKFMELLPSVDSGSKDPGDLKYIGTGVAAVEGEVVGKIAVGHEEADRLAAAGEPYIYVAHETAPDDVKQMKGAIGILTAVGGVVSHAVVVARAWDKCCVVGFDAIEINSNGFSCNGVEFSNGGFIKINGNTGQVWA